MKYLMQRQLGFSLVEIMIGMTLGLFLTIGIIQLYIGSNRNYRFQEEFSRTQENGRFALELLNNNIRMANFTGCAIYGKDGISIAVQNVLNNNTEWWKNIPTGPADWSNVLVGYDGDQIFPGKNFRTDIPGNPGDRIRDTDAIISLGATGSYSVTAADTLTLTLAQIQKVNGGTIKVGDLLFACNDTNTSLFQVTDVTGADPFVISHGIGGGFVPGNNDASLSAYSPGETEVTEYVPTAFYIGVSTSGTSRSLFQMQLEVTLLSGVASMKAQEMVEGVENMQIFYGEDLTPIPPPSQDIMIADVYVDASNVTNWQRVTSVRIELLLASIEDNVLSEPQAYFFPNDRGDSAITGRYVLATDRRWYQTFSTTIGIRNRLN